MFQLIQLEIQVMKDVTYKAIEFFVLTNAIAAALYDATQSTLRMFEEACVKHALCNALGS
jgi:hypothetical protein